MQLLESYREKECLWNHAHYDYRNQTTRNGAFNNMLYETNAGTVEEVKRRIKIIRDTYNIERNKMKKSRLSGPGPNGYYNTKIPWYSTADEFLSKCYPTRNSTNNASGTYCKIEPSSPQSDRTASPESREHDSSDPLWQYADVLENRSHSSNICRKRSAELTRASVPASTKKAIRLSTQLPPNGNGWGAERNAHIEEPNSTIELIQSTRDSIASSLTQPIQDEFLYFGLNLAAQLGELPKLRALLLQEKIQALVSQERIEFEISQHNDG